MLSAGARNRAWRRFALLTAAIATTGAAHAHLDTSTRLARDETAVPSPAQARLLSLGFDAAVADAYWLRALQLVGGSRVSGEERGEVIASLIEVVTGVDPWVDHPYRFAAVWLTRTPELVKRANRLLERGISHHPLDWRNRYHLGFNHFFYLEERGLAADVLEEAVPLDGAPNYLAPLVARLRADQGGLVIAGAFLLRMAKSTSDEYARAQYLKALDEIEIERRARLLDAAREEFWARQGRDIQRVSELVTVSPQVLAALPRAQLHHDGFEWLVDPESGQIVSSYYGSRYTLHVAPSDRARQQRWRTRRAAAATEGA